MTGNTPTQPPADKEDYRLYYQHQYERMKELEQQRLIMTNVIVTISVLAFTLAFSDICKLNLVNGVGLPIVVIGANFIAVMWNKRSREFIKLHQQRAHEALKEFAPEVEELDKRKAKRDSDKDWFRRPSLQSYLHGLLMMLAVLPIVLYLWCYGCSSQLGPRGNKCCPETAPASVPVSLPPSTIVSPTPKS